MTGYDELDGVLSQAGLALDAAEAHGLVCGLVCAADSTLVADDQLSDALAHYGLEAASLMAVVGELADHYGVARDVLERGMSEFQLLLPPEDAGVDVTTGALAAWCRGYLSGLVEAGIGDPAGLPADSREILQDLVAISEAEPESDGDPQGQERALTELEEYVRVGVQLIYEELQSWRERNLPGTRH